MSKLKLRLSNMTKSTRLVIGSGVTDFKICAILLFNRGFLKVQGKEGMHSGVVEALVLIFVDRALASNLSNPIPPTSKVGMRRTIV